MRSWPHRLLAMAGIAAGYFLLSWLGMRWSTGDGASSPIWPASGFAVAALAIGGVRLWPGVAAGMIAIGLLQPNVPPWMSVVFGALEAGSVAAAVLLLQRLGFDGALHRIRDTIALISAGLVQSVLVASAGCGLMAVLAPVHLPRIGPIWLNWWSGCFVGVLVVAPALLTWIHRDRERRRASEEFQLLIGTVATALTALLVFQRAGSPIFLPILTLPPVLYAGTVAGVRGAATAFLPLAVVAILGTTMGLGPFAVLAASAGEPDLRYLVLQQFLAVTAMTGLVLASGAEERRGLLLVEASTAQVAQSEARFRLFANTAPAVLWVTDALGSATFLSQGWLDFTGQSETEALGVGWLEAVHPDDRQEAGTIFFEALERREPFELQCRLRRADGEYRWTIDAGKPFFSESGELEGYVGSVIDIHERVAAELATSSSRRQLQIVSDALPALVSLVGADGRYEFCNAAYSRWFNLPVEQIVGKPVKEVLGGEAWETVRPHMERALAGEVAEYEAEAKYERGGTRWIHAIYTPVKDEKGLVSGVVVHVNDVTERVEAEHRLVEQARLLDLTNDAVIVRDPENRVIYWNQGAEEIYGYSRDEVIGKNKFELLQTVSPHESLEEIHETIHRSDRWEGELKHTRKDGRQIVVWSRWALDRDSQGNPASILETTNDITDRIAQYEMIRRQQEMLAELIERCPFGIYIVDSKFRIASMNAGSRKGAFANVRSPEGRDFAEAMHILWPAPVAEEVVARFRRTLETGEPYSSRNFTEVRHDVGTVESYEWELHRIVLADGTFGVICYYFDSTELHRAQMKIAEQANLLAEESQRKDEFLAMLSHELRNPLAPIRSAVHLLKARELPGAEDPVAQKAREIIERQSLNLTQIVNDLLEVSRVVSGRVRLELQPVDIGLIAAHAAETCGPLIEQHGHAVSLQLPNEPMWVQGDPTRLEQVLTNLINNAAKYTPDGGKIEIRCERIGANRVEVAVRDNGVGIDPRLQSRIFDLFTQADRSLDRSAGGLGIGLALSHRLVEMHRGGIRVESPPAGSDRGSEFTVELPLLDPSNLAGLERNGSTNGKTAGISEGRRVLLVDDNIDLTVTLSGSLRLKGYVVQCAYTGTEGWRAFEQWRPDIVLLDIGLPEIDGYEICRRIRSLEPAEESDVVVIALTGYGRETDLEKSRSAGFDAHLVKPVDPDHLAEVMAVTQRGHFRKRSLSGKP